jgi:hypothetical protein
MRDYMQLPKGSRGYEQSSWYTNAWLIEIDLRQKYMVGFIVGVMVLLWILMKKSGK